MQRISKEREREKEERRRAIIQSLPQIRSSPVPLALPRRVH